MTTFAKRAAMTATVLTAALAAAPIASAHGADQTPQTRGAIGGIANDLQDTASMLDESVNVAVFKMVPDVSAFSSSPQGGSFQSLVPETI